MTMMMDEAAATYSGPALVALRGVDKTFPSGTVALKGLDFAVRAGEFLTLLGPSGCGKSTALRIIAGLSEPTRGTVEWLEETLNPSDAAAAPPAHRLRVPGADLDAVGDRRGQCATAARAARVRAGCARARRRRAAAGGT